MTSLFRLTTARPVWLLATGAIAEDLTIVHGSVGRDQEVLRKQLDAFEAETGHTVTIVSMPESTTDQFGQYRLWLAAQSADIDVYRLDVIWAPQLASHFIDLTPHVADIVDDFVPAAIESQTVDGKLVALPMFLGAPALYYRSDLLEQYGEAVPTTWQELTDTARRIMDAERAAGNDDMWGFVFQGAAYEGLTCNAQEWIHSSGGGRIVEIDGAIEINNQAAADGFRPGGQLGRHHRARRRAELQGRGCARRVPVGQRGLHAQLELRLCAGGGRRQPGARQVRRVDLPAGPDGMSTATLGGWHLGVSNIPSTRKPRSSWSGSSTTTRTRRNARSSPRARRR
jgi:trehalose/maltose transport system substrate-binding protein